MSFSNDLREELISLKVWDNNSSLTQEEQIARIRIREAFIKSGFINNPNKENHLEIFFKSLKKAKEIEEVLKTFGINAKITNKANGKIVYLKDGEDISKFLALIGANNAMLRYEEKRVEKSARNSINRIVNCETANLSKIVEAATIQIENIKYLKGIKKFASLPENLKEIANMRIKNPDASYEELGKMLKTPIGKSGAYHRLNKINKISEEIRNGEK